MKNKVIAGLIFLLLLFPLLFVYKSIKFRNITDSMVITDGKINEGNMFYTCLTIADQKVFMDCFKDKSAAYLKNNGQNYFSKLDDVYRDLDILERNKKITSSACHIVSHTIGQTAMNSGLGLDYLMSYDYNDIIRDRLCGSGYYHGLLIALEKNSSSKNTFNLQVKDYVSSHLTKLNGDMKNDLYLKYISHGLGHMAYVNTAEVDKSISECNFYSSDEDIVKYCYTGVFMQMSVDQIQLGLNPDISYCKSVDERYIYTCFAGFAQTPEFLNDPIKFAKVCNSQKDIRNFYVCNSVYIRELFRNNMENKIRYVKKLCNNSDQNFRKNLCLEQFIEKYENEMYPKDQLKLSETKENLCLSTGLLNYMSCRKILDRDDYKGLSMFQIPNSYFEGKPFDFYDFKYFFE